MLTVERVNNQYQRNVKEKQERRKEKKRVKMN